VWRIVVNGASMPVDSCLTGNAVGTRNAFAGKTLRHGSFACSNESPVHGDVGRYAVIELLAKARAVGDGELRGHVWQANVG
jgi:hypothetical protein